MSRFFHRITEAFVRRSIKKAIGRVFESLENRQMLSVGLDANGYTSVTPSSDTRTIYVSSSQGNDNNDGLSPNSPVRTLGKGQSLLRSGSPDWMLLKKGDTFSETMYWSKSGRSADEPMVIGTYGSGARPLVKESTGHGFYSWSNIHDVDLMGIHFSATTRDPNSPDYNWNPAGDSGIEIDGPANDILVEDCQIEYFRDNVAIQEWQGQPTNIKFRKNVINNSWSTSAISTNGKSQGMYIAGVNGIDIEGNVLDHNGWNERIPGANATIYGHNVYFWSTSNSSGVVFKDNISSNASSHGLQARSGGDIEDNLFVDDPIGMVFGKGSDVKPGGVTGKVNGNVFLGGRDINGATRGWAIEVGNTAPGGGDEISNNIIATDKQNAFAAIRLASLGGEDNPQDAVGLNDLTIDNNIINGWHEAMDYSPSFVNGGSGDNGFKNLTVKNNDFEDNGTSPVIISHDSAFDPSQEHWSGNNYSNSQSQNSWFTIAGSTTSYDTWHAKVDPSGTVGAKGYASNPTGIESYDSSVGGSGTTSDFINRARAMNKDSYNASFTAPQAISYIRNAYNLTANKTTTPSTPTTPVTTTTDGPLDSVPSAPTSNVSGIPQAALTSAPDVTTAGLTELITVKYTDDKSILYGSLDSGDVWVTGPNGYAANAKFMHADAVADGTPRTVTYAVQAPGGSWDAGDNGTYQLSTSKYAVYDMEGHDVPAGSLGSFQANISGGSTTTTTTTTTTGGTLDSTTNSGVSTIPQARLSSAPSVTSAGSTDTVQVTYTDDHSILYGSLDSGDLMITGPNGYSAPAKFLYADQVANGTPRVVTYQVQAPGGSWDYADNGTYTVSVQKYAVYDMSGNDVVAKPIGSFTAAMV